MHFSNTVAQSSEKGVPAANKRQPDNANKPTWQNGDILTATITQIQNGVVSLQTDDDFRFEAPINSIQGNVGDTLQFRVVKKEGKGISLKQIINPQQNTNTKSFHKTLKQATEIKSYVSGIETMSDTERASIEAQQEEQVKTAQAVAQIRRSQTRLAGSASQSALFALVASGLSLEKISFTTLNNVMCEIEKQPDAPLPDDKPATDLKSRIVRSLNRHGLPANDRNVAALDKVIQKCHTRVDDRAIAKLIGDDLSLTPNNVYISRFSVSAEPNRVPSGQWDALMPEVRKHFARTAIADTESNRSAARLLIENDLPLTQDNVEKVTFLRAMPDNTPVQALTDHAAAALSRGENPADMSLLHLNANTTEHDRLVARAMDIVRRLPGVGEIAIRRVLHARETLNLANLCDAAARPSPSDNADISDVAYADEAQTARRQLSEIQLKLTTEAALRLTRNHIHIDTAPLREIVSALQGLDSERHASALRAVGAVDRPDHVAAMNEVFDKLSAMQPLTTNVHARIMTADSAFTLADIHQSVQMARAQAQYDAYATVPNPRYGDSFDKVRGQFGALLESLDMTPTAENIKAAFILSKNHMDLNWENLNAVKTIDAKINAVVNNLHPMIVARMMQDGVRPLDMHVDEALDYIARFKQDMGMDGGDKIARYIMEMDRDGTLQGSSRDSVIAVYRMLNVIRKNDAAAIGLALKQDQNLTFGNLMEAAKFLERRGTMDVTVDDTFGRLETRSRPDQSIRSILNGYAYPQLLAEALTDVSGPANLSRLAATTDLTQYPAEDFLYEAEPSPPDLSVESQALRHFTDAPPDLIQKLQQSGIPVTAGALRAHRRASQQPDAATDLLNELDDETGARIAEVVCDTDLQPLKNGQTPTDICNSLKAALDDAMTMAVTGEQIVRIRRASEQLWLQGRMNQENQYKIPIKVNNNIGTLHLYVLNEQALAADGARVFMSLDTETLGRVSGHFTILGDGVNLQMSAEHHDASVRLEENRPMLYTLLNDAPEDGSPTAKFYAVVSAIARYIEDTDAQQSEIIRREDEAINGNRP